MDQSWESYDSHVDQNKVNIVTTNSLNKNIEWESIDLNQNCLKILFETKMHDNSYSCRWNATAVT